IDIDMAPPVDETVADPQMDDLADDERPVARTEPERDPFPALELDRRRRNPRGRNGPRWQRREPRHGELFHFGREIDAADGHRRHQRPVHEIDDEAARLADVAERVLARLLPLPPLDAEDDERRGMAEDVEEAERRG